ncbi:uncharacterized protein LOC119953668 isoform X3 [Scyliorhinus canicula]|uniref:uncharacterized protein LOC119953668 isoform X3 n=1 Tax=Scyliorhinus canicula TaxID=7830 RepID=UPI0018F65AB7|nr:uncharacterized protein LOC119953668 isoform X3 [Scyliorhinus canicula]
MKNSSTVSDMRTADSVKPVTSSEAQSLNRATPRGSVKKKHPKRTKQVLSKESRKIEELEKAGAHFRSNIKEYEFFLNRMDNWLKTHHQQAMEIFCKYDRIGNGILQYDEFKLGMRDLNIPCAETQLHILTKLLDPDDNGTIDYVELGAGLDKAQYISLVLHIITFNNMQSHPGHFQEVIFSHMKVSGLIDRIQERTGIASTRLRVFKDQSCSTESLLPLELSLEECGFHGGPHQSPPAVLLYYDYSVEFNDCPILNCDYYFTRRKQ